MGRKEVSLSLDFSPLGAGSLGKQPEISVEKISGEHLRTNNTAGDATTGIDVLAALRDTRLDDTFMHPVLFQISLPAIMPRLFVVVTLSLALTVLGLGFLIGAKKSVAASLMAASLAIALLIAAKSSRPSPIHVTASSFGAALTLSMALGWGLSLRASTKSGLEKDWVIKCLGLATLGSLLGARLGYVLFCTPGRIHWRDALNFEVGGLFGYGAYIGGLLGALWCSKKCTGAFRIWLDLGTPAIFLATSLTRIGCYLQGCDFGRPLGANSPSVLKTLGTFPRWKPDPDGAFSGSPAWLQHVRDYGLSTDAAVSLPTHPSQLYEATFALVLALVALHIGKSKTFSGRTFLTMAIAYSSGRYFLEFLRGDSDRGLVSSTGGLHFWCSLTQLLALGSVLLSIMLWRKWQNEKQPLHDPAMN